MRQTENILQKLAVLYIIVWSIAPPLQIDMIYRIAALGFAGVWLLAAVRRGYCVKKVHIYALAFALVVAVIAYVEKGSFDGVLKQIAIYILVICFLINCFYEDGKWDEFRLLVPIILIMLIVFNYRSFQVVLEDHTIARKLVRADESVYQYLRQGVGGYSLIYPQVCIFPAILSWILHVFKENKIYFMIGCIWIFTYIAYLANAGYSIAIFASVVGAFMLFFYRRKNIFMAAMIAGILFALMFWAVLNVGWLQTWLLETFDGTAVADKVQDLLVTSESGIAEGSIQSRIMAYRGSIDVILEYPLLGGLWKKNGGGHSAILDMVAKYGLWGGIIYIVMIFYVPNHYKTLTSNRLIWRISNGVMVSTLFVGILDSFNYSFMCMLVLVLPIIYEDIMRWEGIRYESAVGRKFNTD